MAEPEQRGNTERLAAASQTPPGNSASGTSALRPLRLPLFRNLLIADLASDIGTFMQGVGAAWLMVSQGAGPLLVSLTQTASALPFFLLALPAGALGDVVDRRKLILVAESWMLSVAVVLAALTRFHLITPVLLLILTLALSIGDAVEAPSWSAVLPEIVPRDDLLPAIALNGIEFNLARAIGPALGGFLIAAAGVATAFTLNALTFLGVLWVILRWRRPPKKRRAPPETLPGATRAAFRYAFHEPVMLTILGRIAVIMFFASPFWALLPSVAHKLSKSSTLYGLLLAVFGCGAILGAMALQRLRSHISVDGLLAIGGAGFAVTLWAIGTLNSIPLLCAAIAFGGAAWTAVMSMMSSVLQTVAPDWVRARASAIFLLVYMGTWAGGSAFWGFVAGHRDTHFSFVAAAIGTGLSPLLILFARLPNQPANLGTWDHWRRPLVVGDVDLDAGPVLVTAEYEIEAKDLDGFLIALEKLSRIRRRDGASRWGVYYDTEHPTHILETFIVESWAEHLRQHTRMTEADRETEDAVQRYAVKPALVRHFIYAHPKAS